MRDHTLRQYDMSDASDAAAFWADIDYVDMLQIAQLEAIARDKGTKLPVNSCGRAHERWFQFRHDGSGSMLYSIGSRPHGEAVFSTGHARSANGSSEICAVTNRDVMVAADATMNRLRDAFDDLQPFADTDVHAQLFDGNSETLLRFSTRKRERMLASWRPGGGHRIAFDNRTADEKEELSATLRESSRKKRRALDSTMPDTWNGFRLARIGRPYKQISAEWKEYKQQHGSCR
jgi:hypothetical protein